jgi:ferritin-like protein
MTLTLNLAEREAQRLAEKAQAAGVDVQTYVERIVRAAAASPPLDEVLRPVRDAFHTSGMSDDELGELLEEAKHEMRRERRARQAP